MAKNRIGFAPGVTHTVSGPTTTPRVRDMYAAIDALADKLERRVRKHKEKLTDHHAEEAQKNARL